MVRVRTLAAAVAATLLPALALAQASAPLTRDQVKAETRAAQQAGEMTPAGGGATPAAKTSTKQHSTKTRAQVNEETRAAQKAGELTPAGGGAGPAPKSTKHSTMTKEKRKAETLEARKKGELVPAGGGGPAPSK